MPKLTRSFVIIAACAAILPATGCARVAAPTHAATATAPGTRRAPAADAAASPTSAATLVRRRSGLARRGNDRERGD